MPVSASMMLHLLAKGHYGFFRDELYFIVCGARPDWGYVDQSALCRCWLPAHGLLGDWPLGFRLLPALVMSAVVALTAEFARLLGGGRFAQWLAGLCVLLGPIFLVQSVLLDRNVPGADLAGIRLGAGAAGADRRRALVARIRRDLSVLASMQISDRFLPAGACDRLLATPRPKSLLRPWLWLAPCWRWLVLPMLWQQAHGWPFDELGKAGSDGKNVALSLPDFLVQQMPQKIGRVAANIMPTCSAGAQWRRRWRRSIAHFRRGAAPFSLLR